MLSKKEEIVSRDEVAKSIWDENWTEKYSDWAIDKLMHEIRKKLRLSKTNYNIETINGKGYILN